MATRGVEYHYTALSERSGDLELHYPFDRDVPERWLVPQSLINRMPAGEKIMPGQSRDFTVSAGCWDVDAGSYSGGEARQRMQVRAGGGVNYTVN